MTTPSLSDISQSRRLCDHQKQPESVVSLSDIQFDREVTDCHIGSTIEGNITSGSHRVELTRSSFKASVRNTQIGNIVRLTPSE